MIKKIKVGDSVKLLGLPAWLLSDLPEDEKGELRRLIGEVTTVQSIDAFGYFWLEFGHTLDDEDRSLFSGHNFCVTREFIEPLSMQK